MSNIIIFLFALGLIGNSSKATSINESVVSIPIDHKAVIDIQPQFEIRMGHKYIFKKNNESLNLTCTIIQNGAKKNHVLFDYTVNWITPSYNFDTLKPERGQKPNEAWLWFKKLTENHDGNYTCIADITVDSATQQNLSININLSVIKKPTYCGPKWFRCRSNNCIMERYLCDGKPDCEQGEDENAAAGCGPDPCYGKVICDGRCVPREWCCNHRNCSKISAPRIWPTETQEIYYIQTAFYIVMGCAMAFIFIVTILAIAICRIQFKRAVRPPYNQRNRNDYCQTDCTSVMNVPIRHRDHIYHLNSTSNDDLQGETSTMYNETEKIQFTNCDSKPPSYSEIMALQSQEGPPPGYVSCENLNEYCSLRRYDVQNSYQPDNLLPIIHNLNSARYDETIDTPNLTSNIQRSISMVMPVPSSSTIRQSYNNLSIGIASIHDVKTDSTETDAFLPTN